MISIDSVKFAWLVMEKSDEKDPENLLEIYKSAIVLAEKFNKPSKAANAQNAKSAIDVFGKH